MSKGREDGVLKPVAGQGRDRGDSNSMVRNLGLVNVVRPIDDRKMRLK
jgi:hypothetical protein